MNVYGCTRLFHMSFSVNFFKQYLTKSWLITLMFFVIFTTLIKSHSVVYASIHSDDNLGYNYATKNSIASTNKNQKRYVSNRIIIKLKTDHDIMFSQTNAYLRKENYQLTSMQNDYITSIVNTYVAARVEYVGPIAIGGAVLRIVPAEDSNNKQILTKDILNNIIDKINLEKDVLNIEYAEEDGIVLIDNHQMHRDVSLANKIDTYNKIVKPVDQLMFNKFQWDMHKSYDMSEWYGEKINFFGDNFTSAHDELIKIGKKPGNGVIVAVIDTGYTPHPDFFNQLVPLDNKGDKFGYDFVTDCQLAGADPNDPNYSAPGCSDQSGTRTQQPDGLDLGDWYMYDKQRVTSSWHGTFLMGQIAGQRKNIDDGVLGGAYNAKILPIRVLGREYGHDSDIINGMSWAVGGKIDNLPINANKANILNLSLGSNQPSSCTKSFSSILSMISQYTSSIVVVAAGNSKSPASEYYPANCAGVISVAALGPENKLAWYSNYGDKVHVAASGGDDSKYSLLGEVYSTIYPNKFFVYPKEGDFGYLLLQGTSMATPKVSSAIANLLTIDNTLNTQQIMTILNKSNTQVANQGCIDEDGKKHCITTGRIDVGSAVNFLLNNLVITPNDQLVFSYNNPNPFITISNNTPKDIDIKITTSSKIDIQEYQYTFDQFCSNGHIGKNKTCRVTLMASNSDLPVDGNLIISDANNKKIFANIILSGSVAKKKKKGAFGCSSGLFFTDNNNQKNNPQNSNYYNQHEFNNSKKNNNHYYLNGSYQDHNYNDNQDQDISIYLLLLLVVIFYYIRQLHQKLIFKT